MSIILGCSEHIDELVRFDYYGSGRISSLLWRGKKKKVIRGHNMDWLKQFDVYFL